MECELVDGCEVMLEMSLGFLKYTGNFFSWHQGCEGIVSRIYHALANSQWFQVFGEALMSYLNPSISDHSPLLVNVCKENEGRGRPFRFFKHLASHPGFKELVKDVWQSQYIKSMEGVWNALKFIKQKLKLLHNDEFKGVHARISKFRAELDVVQGALIQDPLNSSLMEEEKGLMRQLTFWLRIDASILR